jgi:hypothetical protein
MIAADLLARYPERKLEFFNRGFCGERIVNLYSRWKIDKILANKAAALNDKRS